MKKIISIMLILIILFSFFMQTIAYASIPETILKYSYGLIAFAAALTAYGVTVSDNTHVKLLYDKFLEWSEASGTTEYLQNAYNQNKMMITSTTIGVAALGIGLNTWIRTQFEKGYNNSEIENKIDVELTTTGYKYKKIESSSESLNVYIKYNDRIYNATVSIENIPSSPPYLCQTRIDAFGQSKTQDYLYKNIKPEYIKIFWDTNYSTNKIYIKLVTGNSNLENEYQYFSEIIILKDNIIEYQNKSETVYYYASEAVDYPMDRYPDDRDINLPPPNLGSPNLTYDGQDYIYTGSPDQFLEEYAENQDYINKALDSVLDNTKSISQPIVDTTEGTITWTNTGAIDYPLNPPIVNPPITVPSTVEEGVGETNSILQGVTEYIGNIFSAPTLALDFSPIMQVALTDKFPFCLPYDLKTLISGFDARAEAPEWELKWKVKDTEVMYKVEFKQFEKLAEITRWGVTLIYVVSLIMISRKLIGGE